MVGVTHFTDKSATYVDVAYMKYLHDLKLVNDYACGMASLTHLYTSLTIHVVFRLRI